ncbi:MAG: endonuclease/exonuclease/phosphatase family protein [Cyanobacteria bacterium P01_A01_bin.83]
MIELSKKVVAFFWFGLLIITAILSIGSIYFWQYPLELLSNFRVYYFLIALIIAVACVICQIWGWRFRLLLFLSLALAIFNSVWIVPWYFPRPQQASEDSIRVLTFNINIQNDRWDEIANSIISLQPDIATIIESSIEAKEELSQRLASLLPFGYRTSGGGLAIFSRFPLISPQSETLDNGTILVTSLQINQKTVNLIAAHPIVPIRPDLFHRRNSSLAEITAYLQQKPESLIFLGDLNLTPWSPYYNRLINRTHIHNTRLGFGIEPSWLEDTTYIHYPNWFVALMKIPIDHIFVRGNIKVINCQTAKAANSDHRILWSDLAL